ncbi:MAG: dienelactone hydrolase family protein [Clostridia bacterium]|nr:dienelactone hydrolase family protein [Clostridia bacterium]
MRNKLIVFCLACLLAFGGVACTPNGEVSSGVGNSGTESGVEDGGDETQTSEVLYQMEDVIKEDVMWDSALFETVPQTKAAEMVYGSALRLEAFKFQSVGYSKKQLDSTWVFATIGTPSQKKFPMPEGGYPAVILLHGGGGQVYTDWIQWWTNRGFVALAFDNYANQLNKRGDNVANNEGGPTSHDGPIFDDPNDYTDSWVYHAVAGTILSNNLLRQRADVDKNRIGLTGISWGSVIAQITSGVDKRFAAFAPVYGSGYLYEDENWKNTVSNSSPADQAKGFGGEDKDKWISLFDPSSYLPYCTRPTLFVSGIDDNCFCALNRTRSAALIKGKAFYAQHHDLGHGHVWQKTPEIYYFFRHVFYGESFDVDLAANVDGNQVTLGYANATFAGVKIVYTTSNDPDSHQWIWETEDVDGVNGKYSYSLPDGVTAFLFETTHTEDEYYRTSTKIYVTEEK